MTSSCEASRTVRTLPRRSTRTASVARTEHSFSFDSRSSARSSDQNPQHSAQRTAGRAELTGACSTTTRPMCSRLLGRKMSTASVATAISLFDGDMPHTGGRAATTTRTLAPSNRSSGRTTPSEFLRSSQSTRALPSGSSSIEPTARLDLDVQNVTNHINPEEIVYDTRYGKKRTSPGSLSCRSSARGGHGDTRLRLFGLRGDHRGLETLIDRQADARRYPAHRGDPVAARGGRPKAPVTLTALLVDPNGTVDTATIDWAFCNQPKPLAELGTVSPLCLETQGTWFTDVGKGIQVRGTVPDIACREFGPLVPVAEPGQPPGRPVDPDTTGGYYQPVRLWAPADDILAIGETRIVCGLAGGSADQSTQFSKQYLPNANPAILSLTAGGTQLSDDAADAGASNTVAAGGSMALEVSWTPCPTASSPPSCGDGVCRPEIRVRPRRAVRAIAPPRPVPGRRTTYTSISPPKRSSCGARACTSRGTRPPGISIPTARAATSPT